jgi:carbon-monoxide dehydrogenase medium subunit
VKPRAFDYKRAASVEEACRLLAGSADARVIAGGQSLVPMMNLRLVSPELLVDIGALDELRTVTLQDKALRIGALVRHRQLETDPLVARHAPLLASAVRHVAHQAVRNRGTLGGSLCHADPAAEFPACMLVLEATMHIASAGGERRVAAGDFFHGMFATALEPGEMLTGVSVPLAAAAEPAAIHEMSRRRGDFALAGIVGRRGPCVERWAAFGIEDRAVRLPRLEATFAADGCAGEAALLAALTADLPSVTGAGTAGRARLVIAAELVRRCDDDIRRRQVAA